MILKSRLRVIQELRWRDEYQQVVLTYVLQQYTSPWLLGSPRWEDITYSDDLEAITSKYHMAAGELHTRIIIPPEDDEEES